MYIPKSIPTDKLLHFFASATIMAIMKDYMFAGYAAAITLVIGLGKELIWDKWLKKGTFETTDLMADIMGVMLTSIL